MAKFGKPKHSGTWKAKKGLLCSKCKKKAAVFLNYSKIGLCQPHFARMFETRVMRSVRQHRMLKKGEKIAVALSGGKDSIVVLHMLHKISKSLPIKLFAISIDEGIGGYRKQAIKTAKKECKKLKVPHFVASFKQEYKKSLDQLIKERGEALSCSFCGIMRRYLLNKTARKHRAAKLAIGHNADDIAQTVMMNFMRNEPGRLARFGPVGGTVEDKRLVTRIRPLFCTPEIDVVAYATLKGLLFHHDRCPYSKNAFRESVRSLLNKMEQRYSGTKLKILNAFLSQLEVMKKAAKQKKVKIGKCSSCNEPSSKNLCRLCKLLGK